MLFKRICLSSLDNFIEEYCFEQQQRMAVEGAREVENGFNQSGRDFNSQMPFSYRVQPMQPNLHERI